MKKMGSVGAAGLALFFPVAAWAAGEAPKGAALSMSLADIMDSGGLLMYVLAALSIAALAFVLFLAIVQRQEAVVPRDFLHDLRDLLAAGRLDEARSMCRRNRSPLAAVAECGIAHLQRAPQADPAMLKDVMEGEGGRQAVLIQNQTQYLLDIAVIAPMIGLLGTVVGMLQSFNVVALDHAQARPMLLAAGVSKALITTAGGLVIGIPAMAFYSFFRGRVAKLTALLEQCAADFLTLLLQVRGK